MRTIGVVSSYLSGSFLGEMYRHILTAAQHRQVRVLGLRIGDQNRTYQTDLGTQVCDAWILLARGAHPDFIKRLIRDGRPVCSIGEETGVTGCGLVSSDNRQGIRLVMAELLASGHRELAFIGNPQSSDIRERLLAFQEVLAEQGLPAEADRVVVSGDFGLSGGWAAAEALHQSGRRVTAVVCGNDQNAAGALQYFRGAGLRVPEDIALVGYDNAPLSSEPNFQLTTLDQQHDLLAQAAVEEVLLRLEQPQLPPARRRVVPRPVFRASFTGTGNTLAEPSWETDAKNDQIWASSELNRYFYGETTSILPILQRFRQFGRTLVHFEVHANQCASTEPGRQGVHDLARLGEALLNETSSTRDFVALYPLFTDERLDAVLLASFPWTPDLTRRAMTLDIAELELTAFAVERFTNKHRLEALLQVKTEELQAARERVVEQAQRSITAHLAGTFAHQLNTPLGAIEASARNLADLVAQLVGGLSEDLPPLTGEGKALLRRVTGQVSSLPLPGAGRSRARSLLTSRLQAWGLGPISALVEALVELGVADVDEGWKADLAAPDAQRVLELAVAQRALIITASVVNQASQQASGFTRALMETMGRTPVGLVQERVDLGNLVGTLITLIRASWSSTTITLRRQDPDCWVLADQGALVNTLGRLLLPEVNRGSAAVLVEVEVQGSAESVTIELASSVGLSGSTRDTLGRAVEQVGGHLTVHPGIPHRATVTLKRAPH